MPDEIMEACVEECKEHKQLGHDAIWGMNFIACMTCSTHITVYKDGLGEIVYDDQMYNFKNKRSTVYTIKPKNYIELQSRDAFKIFVCGGQQFQADKDIVHKVLHKFRDKYGHNLHMLIHQDRNMEYYTYPFATENTVWFKVLPITFPENPVSIEALNVETRQEKIDLVIVFDNWKNLAKLSKSIILEALDKDTVCLLVNDEGDQVYLDASIESMDNIMIGFGLNK